MKIVVDTSVFVAVIAGEPERDALVRLTHGAELVAPRSVYWEVGNAFTAMLRKKRITLQQSLHAWESYLSIPCQWGDIEVKAALALAARAGCYAYDAYVIQCARQQAAPILTLDGGLKRIARAEGLACLEVES